MSFFVLKKIIGPLITPLPVCFAILIAGIVFLWGRKRQQLGKILVSISMAGLFVSSTPWVSTFMIRPLEHKYPALTQFNGLPEIKWVVVLGGGMLDDENISANSQLYDSSVSRLAEGIRIHRRLPGTKLIVSGGPASGTISEAEAMAGTASLLGVDRQEIVLEKTSLDTEDQAILVKKIIGNDDLILVTSASHMPRSMALFKKQGMRPIAAPTDYKTKPRGKVGLRLFSLCPGARHILMIEMAMHEYLGMLWAKMRGRI